MLVLFHKKQEGRRQQRYGMKALYGQKYRMCIYQCYAAYMNAMCNISTSKHVRYKLKVSDKTKRCFIKDEEAEMISQQKEVMPLRNQAPRKSKGFFLEYKMASAGATIWLPDTERFFHGN